MSYDILIHGLARVIEGVEIAVLLMGGLLASVGFLREWRRAGLGGAYEGYRANLGRAILLGLEVLIIADIIGTIAVQPTLRNLSILALIVLIRTFLSFALEVEITGTLPWRRKRTAPRREPPGAG